MSTENITDFNEWRPQAERINGVRMHLGHMSLEQLQSIEGHCRNRVMDAQTDLWIVGDYIARLFPGGDGGDTAA